MTTAALNGPFLFIMIRFFFHYLTYDHSCFEWSIPFIMIRFSFITYNLYSLVPIKYLCCNLLNAKALIVLFLRSDALYQHVHCPSFYLMIIVTLSHSFKSCILSRPLVNQKTWSTTSHTDAGR